MTLHAACRDGDPRRALAGLRATPVRGPKEDAMYVFTIIGACALCALAGFVAGCIAACYDHIQYRRDHTEWGKSCENPANYGPSVKRPR